MKRTLQVLINLAVISMAYPLWLLGWLQQIWEQDQTGMSLGITLLILGGLVSSWFGYWKTATNIENLAPFLGLIGTVVGFIIAFGAVDFTSISSAEGAQAMAIGLVSGISTALYTTLVGAIGYMWLALNRSYFIGD